jgi:hypothetical protein
MPGALGDQRTDLVEQLPFDAGIDRKLDDEAVRIGRTDHLQDAIADDVRRCAGRDRESVVG